MSRTTTKFSLFGDEFDAQAFRQAFRDGEIPVAVYGLGKMGLPLAAVYAEVCGNVIGADVDPSVVATINDGGCHVKREPGLAELVSDLVADDALRAVDDPVTASEHAQVHVVIVPTPITDDYEPDLSNLDAVVGDVADGLNEGDFVVVECTVPPRTCLDRILPRLEADSGLERGQFGLAFCPERTSSGRALKDIRGAYPKVAGGIDDGSTRLAKLMYEEINSRGVIPVSDTTTAEAVKVFEGVYRDVNIALANELATFADELAIDVNEAIATANTQPFCDIHAPGPGVGGHCIPFYPYFLIAPFETETPLLETARAVNDRMPEFTVKKLRDGLGDQGVRIDGARVLLLGLTYRPGVEEIRASPALPICRRLSSLGADVYAVDPMLDSFEPFPATPLDVDEVSQEDFDAVVMVTPHDEFDEIEWAALERPDDDKSVVVIDGRQTLDLEDTDQRVYTIGGGYEQDPHGR